MSSDRSRCSSRFLSVIPRLRDHYSTMMSLSACLAGTILVRCAFTKLNKVIQRRQEDEHVHADETSNAEEQKSSLDPATVVPSPNSCNNNNFDPEERQSPPTARTPNAEDAQTHTSFNPKYNNNNNLPTSLFFTQHAVDHLSQLWKLCLEGESGQEERSVDCDSASLSPTTMHGGEGLLSLPTLTELHSIRRTFLTYTTSCVGPPPLIGAMCTGPPTTIPEGVTPRGEEEPSSLLTPQSNASDCFPMFRNERESTEMYVGGGGSGGATPIPPSITVPRPTTSPVARTTPTPPPPSRTEKKEQREDSIIDHHQDVLSNHGQTLHWALRDERCFWRHLLAGRTAPLPCCEDMHSMVTDIVKQTARMHHDHQISTHSERRKKNSYYGGSKGQEPQRTVRDDNDKGPAPPGAVPTPPPGALILSCALLSLSVHNVMMSLNHQCGRRWERPPPPSIHAGSSPSLSKDGPQPADPFAYHRHVPALISPAELNEQITECHKALKLVVHALSLYACPAGGLSSDEPPSSHKPSTHLAPQHQHPGSSPLVSLSQQLISISRVLSKELGHIRDFIAVSNRGNLRALMSYLLSSKTEPTNITSLIITAICSILSTKLHGVGVTLRSRLDQDVRLLKTTAQASTIVEQHGPVTPPPTTLTRITSETAVGDTSSTVLRSFAQNLSSECCRVALSSTVDQIGQASVRVAAATQRDRYKLHMYQTLIHAPLYVLDELNNEALEQLCCYANDLEGVEIRMLNFVTRGISICGAMFTFLGPVMLSQMKKSQDERQLVYHQYLRLIGFSVCVFALQRSVGWIAGKVSWTVAERGEAYQPLPFSATELENASNVGFLFRGAEIISAVRSLRPLGADVSLMSWWVSYVQEKLGSVGILYRNAEQVQHLSQGPVRSGCTLTVSVLQSSLGASLVLCLEALKTTLNFALPLFAAEILSGHLGASPAQVRECFTLIESVADYAMESSDLWEVLSLNAHKAALLQFFSTMPSEDCVAHHRARSSYPSCESPLTGLAWARLIAARKIRLESLLIKDLSFAYPSAPQRLVLTQKSLSIPLHGLVVLEGSSGGGKSTLLSLILGLYLPHEDHEDMTATSNNSSSRILLTASFADPPCDIEKDDAGTKKELHIACDNLPRSVLRQTIFGFVPQRPQIFAGSVAQNISLQNSSTHVKSSASTAHGDATRKERTLTESLQRVKDAARLAKCDAFITTLPQGYWTTIAGTDSSLSSRPMAGDGVVSLSGGQQQRLCIARAIYNGAQVLLMDEPTSGLDNQTATDLLHNIRNALAEKTFDAVICVTHDARLSKAADHRIQF